jgi:hypothetical protein
LKELQWMVYAFNMNLGKRNTKDLAGNSNISWIPQCLHSNFCKFAEHYAILHFLMVIGHRPPREMTENRRRKRQAKTLRMFRKIHRVTGAALFIFFLFISLSGLLLGWKKHSNGVLLSKTFTGTTNQLADWMPLADLHDIACRALRDSVGADTSLELDRIDVRKEKGVAKFVFVNYYGVQLDGATGEILNVEVRRSDFIENLHDGSVVDFYLGTSDGQFKVFYTTMTGLALLVFTVTGFWLWYGPKQMRRASKGHRS